jgi:uncharacterized damage-inducible protein DinB
MTRGCHSERVGEPTTPPPEDPPVADELTTLLAYVDYYRAVLARKIEGLTDEEARRAACPPSDLTLLGIVRHMADVERFWFRRSLVDEDAPPLFYGAAHPDGDDDGDFHAPPGATVAEALAAYWNEIEVANRNVVDFPLDDIERREQGTRSLRWILVHMVEEYARHAGHADLLRQAIDGSTGD